MFCKADDSRPPLRHAGLGASGAPTYNRIFHLLIPPVQHILDPLWHWERPFKSCVGNGCFPPALTEGCMFLPDRVTATLEDVIHFLFHPYKLFWGIKYILVNCYMVLLLFLYDGHPELTYGFLTSILCLNPLDLHILNTNAISTLRYMWAPQCNNLKYPKYTKKTPK